MATTQLGRDPALSPYSQGISLHAMESTSHTQSMTKDDTPHEIKSSPPTEESWSNLSEFDLDGSRTTETMEHRVNSTNADSPETNVANNGDGLFDNLLSGKPVFANKEVLRPSYTPDQLPHRERQINDIATILVSALRGDTPSNILVYGKTGTGKTASAKYVSQELETTSQSYSIPCDVILGVVSFDMFE